MNVLNKAIFLDRDGVINDNKNHYYVYRIEDFKINEGVITSLKILSKKGYLLIIITNQGGIAKKQYEKDDVNSLNDQIKKIFGNFGVQITTIYYCPHHPTVSACLCRKPDSLLFEKAIARFSISPQESFMIGDSEHDIAAAEKLNITGMKVKSNSNLFEEIKTSKYSFLMD